MISILRTYKSIGQRGITHFLIPAIVFILIFGVGGILLLRHSHAAAPLQDDFSAVGQNVGGLMANAPGSTGIANTELSYNWAAYVASQKTFSKIHGTFTVPTVTCPSSNADTAIWVGFSNVTSNIQQTGIVAQCKAKNKRPSYSAWYQMRPSPPHFSTISIAPGNSITTSVDYKSGLYTMTVTNNSNGEVTKTTAHCNSGQNCSRINADWVVERADTSNGYDPLASWSKIVFSRSNAATGTTNYPLSNYHYNRQNMIQQTSSKPLADVGGLTFTGDGFTVTRQ